MADQANEQLVIEAVLKDMVTGAAGKIVDELKKQNADLARSSEQANKATGSIAPSLSALVPIARRAGGELVSMQGELGKFGGVVVGSLKEAGSALAEIGAAAGATGGTLLTIGAAATGIALVGTGLGIAANKALEFDESMRVVRVAADLTKEQYGGLTAQIKDLQTAWGADAKQAAETAAAAFRFLTKDAAEAGAATTSVFKASKVDVGGGSASELMKVLAQDIKGFGKSASDADDVLGILYATSQRTGAGMVEVGAALAELAPRATVAKVSLEDVAATLAVSSEKAGGLGEAAGALAQFLTQLSKPTSKLSSDLHAFGIDTAVGADGLRDIHAILSQVGDLAQKDGGIIEALSGSSRQGNKIFASAKDDAGAYYDALNKMRAGSFDLASKEVALASEQTESLSRVTKQLGVDLANAGESPLSAWAQFVSIFDEAKDRYTGLSQKIASDAAQDILTGKWDKAREAVEAYQAAEQKSVAAHARSMTEFRGSQFITDPQGLPAGAPSSSQLVEQLNKAMAGASGFDRVVVDAAGHVEILTKTVTEAARAATTLDLASPLARQIDEINSRLKPLLIRTALDPATEKTVEQDLATLQVALANKATLKTGQLDSGTAQALTRTAQLLSVIEQAQAFSADLATKGASGYEKQRLELEGVSVALGRSIDKLSLAGLGTTGLVQQARAALDEMKRATDARNGIEGLNVQSQVLTTQRQQVAAEIELAKAKGDTAEQGRLIMEADQLDGQLIDLNAQKQRAANAEQYRGKSDLLRLANQQTEAAERQAKAQQEIARQALAGQTLALAMKPGQQRLDESLNQRALDLYTRGVMTLDEAVLAVRTDAVGIGEGFKQGMEDVLREYSNSAQRMFEVSQSIFRSIHDEGANALAGFAKGDLSGKNALKQFGKGVLGNAIDQTSSLVMDNLMGGIFGSGHGGDQHLGLVKMSANIVQLSGPLGPFTGSDAFFGGGGLFGGLFGGSSSGFGLPGAGSLFQGPVMQAMGGVWSGHLVRAAAGGVYSSPTMLQVAEVAGRQEAVVPMSGGGITADLTSSGARVRVAGADIPLTFRGGGSGGGGTTIMVSPEIHIHAHSLDPRGAADVVLAQMPQIQRAITTALVRGSDRALRDAVQSAAR